jgi:hypothetical protein
MREFLSAVIFLACGHDQKRPQEAGTPSGLAGNLLCFEPITESLISSRNTVQNGSLRRTPGRGDIGGMRSLRSRKSATFWGLKFHSMSFAEVANDKRSTDSIPTLSSPACKLSSSQEVKTGRFANSDLY